MTVSASERLALAIAHLQHGQVHAAEQLASALISDPTTEAPALRVLGLIAEREGRFALAVERLESALAGLQDLDHLGVLCDLARVLTKTGALASAAYYHYNCGADFFNRDRIPDACFHFERAVEIAPESDELLPNIETMLSAWCAATAHQASAAQKALADALEISAIAALEFANATDSGWVEAQRAWRALPDSTSRSVVYARLRNRLYQRFNREHHDPEILLALLAIFYDHMVEQTCTGELALAAFAVLHCANPNSKKHFDLIGHWWRAWKQNALPVAQLRPAGKRSGNGLRIGIFDYSGVCHLPNYFMVSFVRGIEELQKARLILFVYTTDLGIPSTCLEAACSRVKYFSAWGAEAASVVAEDDLDILLVPNGFLPLVPVEFLIRHPCRRQVVWHHTHTTFGPDLFDATIYEPNTFTPAHRDVSFETPIVLKRLPYLFAGPPEAPPVQSAPRHRNGYITFGVFNRPSKFHLDLVQAWASILDQVPNSRLLFSSALFASTAMLQRVTKLTDQAGIARDRIDFVEPNPVHRDYLAGYDLVDISLDSSPFNGGMITFESMWQGVPVVSCYGDEQLSRSCLGFLAPIADLCGDLAVPTFDQYCETAVRLSQDGERLDALRVGLRDALVASTLMNPDGYVETMLEAFERVLALPDRRGAAWSSVMAPG